MKITYKIIIIAIFALFTFSVTCAETSIIENVRHYTEKEKTRIVIQLDQDAKYQTKYDKEHNLIISLVNGKIGSSQNLIKVNDGLVGTVSLKEEKGKANIIISFTKPAAFNVFPLESPNRIVIDTTTYENILTPGVIEVEEIEQEPANLIPDKASEQNTIQNNEMTGLIEANTEENTTKKTNNNLWFSGADYGIISAFFDVLILGIVIYMDIKITNFKKANDRTTRRNRKAPKEQEIFANMIEQTESE
jgi:predicted transcriptional regulator